MRSLLEAKLAEFIFAEAKDGLDALTKFNPETIDIVFADWNMPNMSGIDMVKQMRTLPGRRVPIVMVTTEGTMARLEEALNQGGVDSYIVKPFTTDIIQKKLEPLFDKMAEARQKPQGFFSRLATKVA